MSDWLIISNKKIQQIFISLLLIHLSLGAYRFLFPFLIVGLGGDSSLISFASTLASLGQLFGFILLGTILARSSKLNAASIFLVLLFGSVVIIQQPLYVTFFRFLDGLGHGLLFLWVINTSAEFPQQEGEVIGYLLAAMYIGLALGQITGGLLLYRLKQFQMSVSAIIQLIMLAMTIITALPTFYLIYREYKKDKAKELEQKSNRGWKLPHIHLIHFVKKILSSPLLGVLIIIYALYDFSHGLYTPNLSLLLNQQGLSEFQISIGYLAGDSIWGLSQIVTGKLVDRTGYKGLLILSLFLKGITVFMYLEATILIVLLLVLIIAGLAEGLLEPARNKAALTLELQDDEIQHTHRHVDFGFTPSGSFVTRLHTHEHNHITQQEQVISLLQTMGIISFGLGSLTGSLLYSNGYKLPSITILGAIVLIISAFIGTSLLRLNTTR